MENIMMMAFAIRKSIWGEYWQVRARDLQSGAEDTVDRLYSQTEIDAKRASLLTQGWQEL